MANSMKSTSQELLFPNLAVAAYNGSKMKSLTIRLPETLFAEIAREAEARKVSKSEIVRERLELAGDAKRPLCDEMDDLEAFELMANLLSFARPAEQAA
jgi:hypothetical protein